MLSAVAVLGMLSSSARAQDSGPVYGENGYKPYLNEPKPRSLSEQLTGTWKLDSIVDVFEDGERRESFGPEASGSLNFDGHGHFMMTLIGTDKIAEPAQSPPRSERPVVAYFGTYTVDEKSPAVIYTVEKATSTRLDGTDRRTVSFELKGNEITEVTGPIKSPKGQFWPNITWKRAN